MTRNFENNCIRIYEKLFNSGKSVYGGAKSLLQECIDFETKWNIMIDAGNIQFRSETFFENLFESTKSKILRKTKKCVIFGNVSSGKSTLTNALLTKIILPTDFGSTSNCFVEITGSPTNENYLFIENMQRNIEELKELNNIKSTNHLENGSLITMYYDKTECELLNDDVVIIDAPGSNSTFINDNSMEEYFNDADVVVLVVSAISGITTLDEQFFREFRTAYAKLNVIIVYNFWDFVNPNGDNISLKEQCINSAKNILCNMLQHTDTEADSSIFFISASERLRILTNNITPTSGTQLNERNESFKRFLNYLKVKMSESLFTKNYTYLKNLNSMVTTSLNQCKNCVSQMKYKRSNISQNLKSEIDNGFKETFERIISVLFEVFFEEKLYKNIDVADESDNEELSKLIVKIVNKSLKKIKKIIRIVIIKSGNEHNSTLRQNIFNELYFPRYFNLNKELKSFDIQEFRENLMKIKVEIETNENIKGIGIGLIGAIFGGLLGSIKGAATGFLAGCQIGNANQPNLLPQFRSVMRNNDFFRKLQKSFQTTLKSSYSEFIDSMVSNVTELITPIEYKINNLQNDLNNIAEELQRFQRYFSLN